ncbi:hypothetical protein [uncultured Prevotella sp.]|uniref:hypothetical protein n=1 Tax=uncultured Prevotella sp. TaxID=159272 RepID=UPI0026273699|nr:hypothetical protein [uncultured Prevotella sp.]
MNRMNNFLLMGSVALSGIVAFSACSSENDMGAEVNPTFDGKTVKTQFALNVPYGDTGTRMSAEATQKSDFRGISNMVLLPFNANVTGTETSTSFISLNQNTNAFESDGNTYANQGRYIYRDVKIPIGTKHFVFYGKATGTETTTSDANKLFDKGYLSNNLSGTTSGTPVSLDNTNFALQKINETLNLSTAEGTTTGKYDKVLKALQNVTDTKVTVGATTIEWNNITSATDMKLDHAKKLWEAFSTLKAGSANSVRKTLNYLKSSAGVGALGTGTATADGDGLLKTLVTKIDEALTTLGDDNDFPADFNLPDGAVGVNYDVTSKKWKFNSPENMNINTINYANITYPASLDYFVSSPAKARDDASTGLSDGKWPAKDEWTKDNATWTGWGDEVKNTTRTIALEKAIQYGVANLKLTIKANASTLSDNAQAKGGQVADQNVDVTNKLVMTGVLIGGQPEQVEWNYEPKTTGTTFDLTIYDKKMNGATASAKGIDVLVGTASTPNYTLVLDNNNATTKPIYVAVELVNKTGIDFYGANGMIPADGKFYLIGKLDPNNAATVGENPKGVDRVFLKDYTTTANLTIKDLKNAYNVIPDLRSTAISVGLAVNLEWQEGITFNVEI